MFGTNILILFHTFLPKENDNFFFQTQGYQIGDQNGPWNAETRGQFNKPFHV